MRSRILTLVVIIVLLPCTLTASSTSELPDSDSTGDANSPKENNPQRVFPFKFNFDFRARQIFQENVFTFNDDAPNTDWNWQRYRLRGGFAYSPADNFTINTRLAWEFRHYNKFVNPNLNWDKSYVLLDRLNFTWKNVGGMPLTITAGRQDIILDSAWLVLDATPGDGSRTIYFDAVRADYSFKEINSALKVIYLNQGAESEYLLPTLSIGDDNPHYLIEEDQQGGIFHFTNKSITNTEINAYFMTKDTRARRPTGWTGDTHVFGGRVLTMPDPKWQLYGEAAFQRGDRNGRDISAFGANSSLTYKFNDPKGNTLSAEYEYLSGDDPNTVNDESFDLMWGRWPRWSELYIYCMFPENGRIAQITNLQRVAWAWNINPHPVLNFKAFYHLLYANENPTGLTRVPTLVSENGSFRGQLLTGKLSYNFAKHIPGHILVEKFFANDYYSPQHPDNTLMVRFEIGYAW